MNANNVDLEICIEAMRGSMMLRGKALQIELSVGLYVFYTVGSTDINAKKTLRGIYSEAGQADCINSTSESYQTVNRRINYISKLYEKLKSKTIKKWASNKKGQQAIDLIIEGLSLYEFAAMDNVRAFISSDTKKVDEIKNSENIVNADVYHEIKHRRATDVPGTLHIKTEHIDIPIPPNTAPNELIDLAMQLIELSKHSEKLAA